MMTNKKILIVLLGIPVVILTVLMVWALFMMDEARAPERDDVASFEECLGAEGSVVMESYPRQCRTEEGETFTEDIGNVLAKENIIRIDTPRPNALVASPLVVKGEARGTWYFEADFPVELEDANGTVVAFGIAQAQGDWMTENFVPYEVTLTFTAPTTETGTLVLKKDNPSGLPENDDELRIPVRFTPLTQSSASLAKDNCVITGCSSQLCADQEMYSICDMRPEYACYKTATCERQQNGECGWTQTAQLKQCLQAA